MRSRRLSIGLIMVVIAVFALDLALARVAMAVRGPDLAALYLPIALACQVAFLIAACRPTGRRFFWVGFACGGICAMAGSDWLEFARPESVMELWTKYLAVLEALFGRLPRLGASNPGRGLVHFAVVTGFFLPAQLLLSFAGAILAAALGKASIRRSGQGGPDGGSNNGFRRPFVDQRVIGSEGRDRPGELTGS